jgi:hypothetical protein
MAAKYTSAKLVFTSTHTHFCVLRKRSVFSLSVSFTSNKAYARNQGWKENEGKQKLCNDLHFCVHVCSQMMYFPFVRLPVSYTSTTSLKAKGKPFASQEESLERRFRNQTPRRAIITTILFSSCFS